LSATAQQYIADPNNLLFVSAITPYEIAVSVNKGTWPQAAPYLSPLAVINAADTYGFLDLPITRMHGLHAAGLPQIHKDPWNRVLIAQSIMENMPLVSKDPVFAQYGVQQIW
jgi:PIN domain nuclease of toxin-antitoxin system